MKKEMRRVSAWILSLALTLTLCPWALSTEPTDTESGAANDIVRILYTNDIHTYIDNTMENGDGETVSALRYSTVAGYREAVNADFLVDAGDHIQGTSYGTYDKGHTIINLMNAAGYTAATLGNHEFDYDMEGTRNAIEWADFDYVSCNIINTDGTPLLPSYKVYEAANGKKVAFVGITTPESITKSTPAYFMNEDGEIVWSFSEGDEGAKLYAVVQSAIDAAAQEADYVIGVGHMGVDTGSVPYTSEDVIRNTSGFTAFIDGHSHTKMEMQKVKDKTGKEIVLTQTKCYLEYVGEMTIDGSGNVTAQLHDAADLANVVPDPEVKAIEDEIIGILAEEQSRVIAHTDVRLDTHNGDERLVRKQETAIGNFCADATYYYFDSRGYDIDAAFMNGGGIRAPLDGDITGKTLKDIYPWGNVLCLVDMTGQQILDGLEFGAKNVNWQRSGESGGFLHVSGLKYEIDASVPNTTQSDDNGIWTGGPTGKYRVSNVQVKNRETGEYEPLDLDKHYAVGGINYTLRNMGDGFAMFTGENIVDGVAVDYMALEEYAQSFPVDSATGLPTLKANMGYDAPEGRIVITGQVLEDYTGKTVILHSNDVHGAIMGYSYIAALRTEFAEKGADVILVDAGDFSQGDPTVSLSKGADAITMMNAAGYSVATLGNHEFDFGYEQLMSNLEESQFVVVCADVYKDDEPVLAPCYAIETEPGGLTIGFFGMETPETQTKVNPGLIQGIHFVSNTGSAEETLYTCAQEQIDELRENGTDIVIALTHLGVDAESAPDGHRSVDLYRNTEGIDMILDGHSHTVMTGWVESTDSVSGTDGRVYNPLDPDAQTPGEDAVILPIQSTGTKFANIGVVVIDDENKTIEDHYLLPTEGMAQDETVVKLAQSIIDRVDEEYGEVFAQSEILLNGERAPGNRTEETNLGDLITDAIVWKVLNVNRDENGTASLTMNGVTVDENHIVGITNGGGIRASIQPGDVTRKDLNTVLPFGNTVAVVFVTGAELLETLEASTYSTPEALGAYPQTFGIEFTLDTTKEYAQGSIYPESTYYSPATIQRVSIIKINGEPFDEAATYAVVTNNFCAAGGDTYYVFKNAGAQFDTGIVMDEAVMEYVHDALGGVISRETYETPRGDQTILTETETRFHFSPSLTGGQADAPCTFEPSWFFQPAQSNYQSGLAQLSIRTAMAAFGTDAVLETDAATEQVRYLSEEATDSTSANIVRLMQDLGFSRITADYQNPGLDTIGYAIANREISSAEGETARLILIAVRGGGYRQEWASNFTIGLSQEHQGFSEAASMVFETAQTYLSELREDGYDGAVKFWITGYSRGAAVANLTAQRLTALADSDNSFTRDDVFAYCFACPRNVVLDSADALSDASAYDNIINVVHYADFVPKIPVSPWGYGRYGKTYYLPSPELTAQYPEALEKMTQSLSVFLSSIDPEPDTVTVQQSVWALTHLLSNQGRLTDRFTNTLAVHVGSQSAYVDMVQKAFRDVIEATEGKDGFGAFFTVLTGLPGYYEHYQQSVLPITQNGTQISLAHAPELYLAWLDALERADEYSPEGRSRTLVLNGSADVTVFDESETVAAQITDSNVTDSTLPAYADPDGQTIISLPPDGTFRIELTSDADVLVSYQIEETDLETGITDRLTGYEGILLAAGDHLTGTAAALAAGVRDEYPLFSANNGTLTPDTDIQEAVQNCRVTVSVRDSGDGTESGGFAQGGGLYVPGEYAQVLAVPADDAAFLGWYENGTQVSEDAQFRFPVTADRNLTAVFSSEKPVYQVSVEGGSGSGEYQQGSSVSITADTAPDGQVFDRWLGADGLNFTRGSRNSANATFIMPGNDVTLTATFRAQSSQNTQGCYVATAVYGSYDCPEVWTLRRFRDEVLAETWYGRVFIRAYYAVSPAAVKLFGDCDWFRNFFRDRLDTMVSNLQADGFASTPYQDQNW